VRGQTHSAGRSGSKRTTTWPASSSTKIDHLDGVLFIDKADPATIHKLSAEEAAAATGEAAEAAVLMDRSAVPLTESRP